MINSFSKGLSFIPLLSNAKTRSISAENPSGKVNSGGNEASHLGVGRKGRPCITLNQDETTTLAEINEAGIIQHIWITVTDNTKAGYFVFRDLVLRMYWDGEKNPSVEVPLGDFFCNGFGARCDVNSLPVVVNPTGGFNTYFPMPFRTGAKITIENQHAGDITGFFYQITYSINEEIPENAAYFHARWNRENLTREGIDYTILDNIKGKGHYVGTYLAWGAMERFWWGEGEIKFYIDEDEEWPTINGTGTEDYFGGAWCFYNKDPKDGKKKECTYSTPYMGYPYFSEYTNPNLNDGGPIDYNTFEQAFNNIPKHGLYRWHILDPIRFEEKLKVTIQQIGHNGKDLFERTDDISSVGYWYQKEPHNAFPEMITANKRWPR